MARRLLAGAGMSLIECIQEVAVGSVVADVRIDENTVRCRRGLRYRELRMSDQAIPRRGLTSRLRHGRRWVLAFPTAWAVATLATMLWVSGVFEDPVGALDPDMLGFLPFILWNLAPYVGLAATIVLLGNAPRVAWRVLVVGNVVVGIVAFCMIAYALGLVRSSTSGLVFLSLPVVLWVAVLVLSALVWGMFQLSGGGRR